MGEDGFYTLRNVPPGLKKAIRVAAALEGVKIWEFCNKALAKATRDAGVVMEEGD